MRSHETLFRPPVLCRTIVPSRGRCWVGRHARNLSVYTGTFSAGPFIQVWDHHADQEYVLGWNVLTCIRQVAMSDRKSPAAEMKLLAGIPQSGQAIVPSVLEWSQPWPRGGVRFR